MAAPASRSEASGHLDRRPHPVHGRLMECWLTDRGHGVIELAGPVVAPVESRLLLGTLSRHERNPLEVLWSRWLQDLKAGGFPWLPDQLGASEWRSTSAALGKATRVEARHLRWS